MTALLAVLAFVSAMVIDYAEARYVWAVNHGWRHRAAVWSLVMYSMGCLGFVLVLNESLWLMIPEGLGFYAGTLLAMRPGLQERECMAPCLHGSGSPD